MARWLLAVVCLVVALDAAGAAPCPDAAGISIFADNRSGSPAVTLQVEGELLDASATCSGAGATTYTATVVCGPASSQCGRIDGLRPGAWVHRVRLHVPGSDEQVQSQRLVILAAAPGVSNVVSWTVYPRTFVVGDVSGETLRARLNDAAAFTAATGAQALVTFDRNVFPGAGDPQLIRFRFTPRDPDNDVCDQPDEMCSDGRKTTYCLSGSRITVDALDARGAAGGVEVSVGKCARSIMRVTGSDNVLRGLVLRGSQKIGPTIPLDTIALSGPGAQRNRLEALVLHGPTMGDGISVEGGAGTPGGAAFDNVIVDSEITGAEDKGIKVTTEGCATIASSCVHDNRNGGIQATLGGHVRAVQNVVQLNRLGPAQNGLLVGVPEEIGARNTLETDGNVVRFSGARGISVVNAGTGTLLHDVVTENQQAGVKVESTLQDPGAAPIAALRGVTMACNHKRLTGVCQNETTPCTDDAQCMPMNSCVYPQNGTPSGTGLSAAQCTGCPTPGVDLGSGGRNAGRNALTWNRNPDLGSSGINLANELIPVVPLAAAGNQWEQCGVAAQCNVSAVQTFDIRPAGPASATLGTPTGPGGGPPPMITRIAPARPRTGEYVRVYNGSLEGNGGTFNVVDGTDCSERLAGMFGPVPGLPTDPCSPESAAVVAINQLLERGNTVTITMDGQPIEAEVHAVTPTMLIFRMPVDCHAAATLVVRRGNDAASLPASFCDPGGCVGRPAGAPCDDGSVCTIDERCDGDGQCVASTVMACTAACETGACDPVAGCVVRSAGAACSDADACTAGDHCDGSGPGCVPGAPMVCAGACRTGACDPASGCVAPPAATSCDDGDPCTLDDRCDSGGTCVPGAARSCDDGNSCTTDRCDAAGGCTSTPLPDGSVCEPVDRCRGPALCRDGACDPGPALDCGDGDFCTDDRCAPETGCVHEKVTGVRRSTCRVEEARAIIAGLPTGGVARQLGRRLDRAERVLQKAEPVKGPRRTRRVFAKARGELRLFLVDVRRARARLGAALVRDLTRSVKLAISNATVSPPDA